MTLKTNWGLLGPEFLPNTRRTRTLGLGASVRLFNDLAVPGLGGIWYCKQLLLFTLGVAVAQEARKRGEKVQNIEVTNAVEALACWQAFNSNGWKRDARMRGNTKLQGKDNFSFRRMRQRNFYVTQPMRMASVQALPALGFVDSDSVRFNSFRCTNAGIVFIDEATKNYRPHKRTVLEFLINWVQDKSGDFENSPLLTRALSPLSSLPEDVIPLLRERLIQGGSESIEDQNRRSNALAWVELLRTSEPDTPTWDRRPQEISEEHWHDLQAGALFFETRESAISVLDALEVHIGNQTTGQSYSLKAQVPEDLNQALEKMKLVANKFLGMKHADEDANKFCYECINDDPSVILRSLVERDGHVLHLVADEIKPGPAFRGSATHTGADDSEDQDMPKAGKFPFPEGISHRMRNLYLLNLDMNGELDGWLNPNENGEEA